MSYSFIEALPFKRSKTFIPRLISLLDEFGFTPNQINNTLNSYIKALKTYNVKPTFPVTACIVKRYPQVIKSLQTKGAEFAIHGWVHRDYKNAGYKILLEHINKAKKIFKENEIKYEGFRAPYLRKPISLVKALNESNIAWDGTESVYWQVFDGFSFDSRKWDSYKKLLDFYESKDANRCTVLPEIEDDVVKIPVSMPDDEALIDRLRIKDAQAIATIWNRILKYTYDRGEVFVLQLHHERFHICKEALELVLTKARSLNPPVWIATLDEVARWWVKRTNDRVLWPNGARSALSITGDIDAMTLGDFILRIFEWGK